MFPVKFFKKTITYSFYSLFFLTPLILTTSNFELFEFPKMLFVYAMTVVITAAWIGLWTIQGKITIRKTPFDYFFGFFLISQILSTVFSIDPYTSLFGYYSRFHGGLLSTICYLALFYAFTSNLSKKESLNSVFAVLCSAALSSLYAVAEHFGIDSSFWVQDVKNRVFSTLGQPNWLAAFLTAIIPIVIALGIKPPKSRFGSDISLLLGNTLISYILTTIISGKTLPTTPASLIFFLTAFTIGIFLINAHLPKIHQRVFKFRFLNFYLLFILFVTTTLFTKSRSGILALTISFIVFWILIFLKNFQLKKISHNPGIPLIKHFFAFCFLLFALVFVIGTEWTPSVRQLTTYNLQLTTKNLPNLLNKPNVPKYAPHISESSDIRKSVWEGAIRVWQNWPLTGSGVETFAYSYYNFRLRSHNDVSEWDFLYNKAHNEYLNFLATTGILGTIAIFAIILFFFYINLGKILPKIMAAFLGLTVIGSITYITKPQLIKFLLEELLIYPPLLKPIGIALGFALIITITIIKVSQISNLKSHPPAGGSNLKIALSSSMFAIIITNFYGFSVVVIGLVFFFLCAFSCKLQGQTLGTPGSDLVKSAKSWKKLTPSQSLCLALISLVSLISLSKIYNYWRADYLYNNGKDAARGNQMLPRMQMLEKAIVLRPKEALYHSALGEAEALAAYSLKIQDASSSAQQIKSYSEKASREAEITLNLNPVHINFYKEVAKIYLTLAQADPSFYQKAIDTLHKGWQLSPTDPKLPYNLGLIAQVLGKDKEAELFFEKTVELRPAYQKAWLDLGSVKTKLGKKDEAVKAYQFILENIDPNDESAKKAMKELNQK